MVDENNDRSGEPGMPGMPGTSEGGGAGGAGGMGGVGGEGGETGGIGGEGGAGGAYQSRSDAVDLKQKHMENREGIVKWFKVMVFANILTIVMILAVGSIGWIANNHRIQENQHNLTEIQTSRIMSCRATYITIQTILLESRKGQPPLDTEGQTRFNNLMELANPDKCVKQVNPENPPPPPPPPKIGG